MAKWEKESGTLQFTKAGYQVVVREFRARFNARQAKLLEVAKAAYDVLAKVKPADQRKRFEDFNPVVSSFARDSRFHVGSIRIELDFNEYQAIRAELFRGKSGKTSFGFNCELGSLTKPRAVAFPTLKNTERSFVIMVQDEDSFIKMDEKAHTLRWYVEQGNRSVSSAHNTEAYGRYFGYLNNDYAWKKGEGGYFTMHEEDLSDDEDSSGTVSSTSAYFGPVGKKVQDDAYTHMISMARGARRR